MTNEIYPCPICKQDVSSIISFENLVNQYSKEIILFCPHCSVGLELDYDEYVDDDGDENSIWTVKLKCLP